jgi:hypothetical protein
MSWLLNSSISQNYLTPYPHLQSESTWVEWWLDLTIRWYQTRHQETTQNCGTKRTEKSTKPEINWKVTTNMHASDWLLQYSQWLCQFPALGVGQSQTITKLPGPSTMNYYDHSIWTKNLHKAMNRVGDTTPQEMPNISMRLQTKFCRNTLKVTIVSIWSDQNKHDRNECGHNLVSITCNVSDHQPHQEWEWLAAITPTDLISSWWWV